MAKEETAVAAEQDAADDKKKKKKKKKGGEIDALATDQGGMYIDADEDEGFSFSVLLIIIFIVIIWLAILCLLVKLDIGGFGSEVLYPVLKDVPVVSMILPEPTDESEYVGEFDNLPDALAEIKRLNAQIDDYKEELAKGSDSESEEVKALKEEIVRLRTFEDNQIEFDKLKTQFYEEVVFGDEAPSIDNYKAYYEEIDPENAEFLYKQVVEQLEEDQELDEYVQAYTDMKPKQAAAIFEMMTDDLDLVAKILGKMDPSARAKILEAMDSDIASKLTKIMNPD